MHNRSIMTHAGESRAGCVVLRSWLGASSLDTLVDGNDNGRDNTDVFQGSYRGAHMRVSARGAHALRAALHKAQGSGATTLLTIIVSPVRTLDTTPLSVVHWFPCTSRRVSAGRELMVRRRWST